MELKVDLSSNSHNRETFEIILDGIESTTLLKTHRRLSTSIILDGIESAYLHHRTVAVLKL